MTRGTRPPPPPLAALVLAAAVACSSVACGAGSSPGRAEPSPQAIASSQASPDPTSGSPSMGTDPVDPSLTGCAAMTGAVAALFDGSPPGVVDQRRGTYCVWATPELGVTVIVQPEPDAYDLDQIIGRRSELADYLSTHPDDRAVVRRLVTTVRQHRPVPPRLFCGYLTIAMSATVQPPNGQGAFVRVTQDGGRPGLRVDACVRRGITMLISTDAISADLAARASLATSQLAGSGPPAGLG